MKINILIFILCLLSVQISSAQNEINGKITDIQQNPLPGATVFIPELNKGTVAGADGNFSLQNIPNGKIQIIASFMGYNSEMKTIQFSGGKTLVNFVLQEKIIESEEVVVSAGYHSTQDQNAVKICVLKMNSNNIKLTGNFTEVLTRVPGIDMISKGNGVAKPVIRGLSMDNVLILDNGVRNENYQYSDHHPLGIDEFGIDDIEIIKGPASLLYGSDAIGGVINFLKEKPAITGRIEGDYNLQLFSNSWGMTNNFGLKAAGRSFFGGFRFGEKTNSDYLQGGGLYVPNSRFNELSYKLNGGYSGKNVSFKLYYDFDQDKIGLTEPEAVSEISRRGRKPEIWYQQFDKYLLSSQTNIFMNRYKLEINSAFQSTSLVHFAGLDTTEISMKLNTLTYEAKLYLPSDEKSEYIIGFQGLNQANINDGHAEEVLLPDAQIGSYALFGLVQHSAGDKIKLQAGLRYDYKTISTVAVGLKPDPGFRPAFSNNYGSFSCSLGGTWNLTHRLLFRANFASAYRTPNIAELTSNGRHEIRYEQGNASLVPQKAYESDLSIHYHAKNISLDLAGFYNRINHFIFLSPTTDSTLSGEKIYRFQQSDAMLLGGEAAFTINPVIMKWFYFESSFSTVIAKRLNGEYLPFIPADKLGFEVRAEKDKFLFLRNLSVSLNSRLAFAQNKVAPEESISTGYTLFDFGIGADLIRKNHKISVSVNVNNLLDKKYIDHLSTLQEVNYFNPGRNIVFSIKIPFWTDLKTK